ncbi:MAG TPA: type II toxin-antitoxin system prevent-host-death family antitoxin [Firmicutes bacterium]|nr:type II toxin-antitoxin system prevent-host-death family antitoxin [Bacillota bacterium]
MDHVGIRELKNHLGKYLTRVKEGETIVVTEHNHPIATLAPTQLPLPEGVRELISQGLASWPKTGCKPYGNRKPPVVRGNRTLASMVAEDRR